MNIKRIIAREGIILSGILVIGGLLLFGGSFITSRVDLTTSTLPALPDGFILDADIDKIKTNINKMDALGVSAKNIDKYILSEGLTLEGANKLNLRPQRDYYKEEIDNVASNDLSSLSYGKLLGMAGFNSEEQDALLELRAIRNKYPEYKNLDAETLISKMAMKFPQYKNISHIIKLIFHPPKVIRKINIIEKILGFLFSKITLAGIFMIFFAYPLYLFIRFIFWSIRTLKNE